MGDLLRLKRRVSSELFYLHIRTRGLRRRDPGNCPGSRKGDRVTFKTQTKGLRRLGWVQRSLRWPRFWEHGNCRRKLDQHEATSSRSSCLRGGGSGG